MVLLAFSRALALAMFCLCLSTTQSFQTVSGACRRQPGDNLVDSKTAQQISFNDPKFRSTASLHHMVLADAVISDSTNIQSFMTNANFCVFLAGIFPFAWATVEFWRRIAFGEPFGTGSDSVVIGIDDSPSDSRGRRVLGKGALVTAYVLFSLAFGTIAIVIYSVLSSDVPPDVLPTMISE